MNISIAYCTVLVREADLKAKLAERPVVPARQIGLAEGGLVRWVCRSPAEAIAAVKRLEGLGFRDPSFTADDIAVFDAELGLLAPCPWLSVAGAAAQGWTVAIREPGDPA
jgi:hypothetical protein